MFFHKKVTIPLPAPTTESLASAQQLDRMVQEYQSMDENKDFGKKWDYFWTCHTEVCAMHRDGKLFLYAGDCELEYLKTIIDNDGPEYSASVIFGTDESNLYEIGVCVRGTSILKRVTLQDKDVQKMLRIRTKGVGLCFGK